MIKKSDSHPRFPLSLISTAALLCLYFQSGIANTSQETNFPLPPKLMINAQAGSVLTSGISSIIPMYGNPDNMVIFAGVDGDYGSHNSYLASPGIGARFVKSNQMLGTYLYGDYNRSVYGGSFFVYNPGIEWMSTRWDAHVNGYLLQTHRQRLKNLGFLSDQGNLSFASFTGHSAIDHELIQYDIAGNGVDAEIGYSLNVHGRRGRVFLGSYHYAPQSASHITGAQAGFDYLINPYVNVGLAASHDNVYQTKGVFTISLILGNRTLQAPTDVRERFTDFIPRHLGTLNTGSGLPTQRKAIANGATKTTANNIWFFQPGLSNPVGFAVPQASLSQCTAENPCTGINQNLVDSINALQSNALLYLAPGNYTFATSTALNLNAGQSIWGRTSGYKTAASGTNRALISNGLSLVDNNTIDSLQITNTASVLASATSGIYSNNTLTGTFTLNNLNINASSTSTLVRGIFIEGGQGAVSVTNSTVNVAATAPGAFSADGLRNLASGSLLVDNSTFNSITTNSGASRGLINFNGSANISNSTFNAQTNGAGNSSTIVSLSTEQLTLNNIIANSIGTGAGSSNPFVNFDGNVNINNSTFNAQATGTGNGASIDNEGAGTININNSTLYGSAANASGGSMNLIYQPGTGAINLTNTNGNSINASSTNNGPMIYLNGGTFTMNNSNFSGRSTGDQQNYGMYADGNASASIANSTLSVFSANAEAFGVATLSSNSIIFNNVALTIAGNNASAVNTGSGTVIKTGGTCSLNGVAC